MPLPIFVNASAGEVVKVVLRAVASFLGRQLRSELNPTLRALRVKVEKSEIQRAFENAQVLFNEEMVNAAWIEANNRAEVALPPMWFRDP